MSNDEMKFMYRLDERVDAIGERISNLEGKINHQIPKNFRHYISEYGGVVALILSIFIGTFTVYEKLVVQPQQDEASKFDGFRRDISALAQISAQAQSISWEVNSASAAAEIATLWPQRMELLERIDSYMSEHPVLLKFTEIMLLANENENLGLFDKGLIHAENAINLAVGPWEEGNAYAMTARLEARLNRPIDMRTNFAKGIEAFMMLGINQTASALLNLYSAWIYFELVQSQSCDPAIEVFDAMRTVYSSPDVWPATRNTAQRGFRAMLTQVPKTCELML